MITDSEAARLALRGLNVQDWYLSTKAEIYSIVFVKKPNILMASDKKQVEQN